MRQTRVAWPWVKVSGGKPHGIPMAMETSKAKVSGLALDKLSFPSHHCIQNLAQFTSENLAYLREQHSFASKRITTQLCCN